jgi:hypothetical protein
MSLYYLVFQAPQPEPTGGQTVDGGIVFGSLTNDPATGNHRPEPEADGLPLERHGRPMLLPVVVLVISILTALGCAKPPEHPWVARDGLIEINTYNRGKLFVRPDHHLGDYDKLLIDHVGFRYGNHQKRLANDQEDRIVSMLLGAIQGSQDGTIGLAATPGPCVLTVNFFLKDLEFEAPDRVGGSQTIFISSYGAATMVVELRDSMDQDPLARFIQRRDLGGGRATHAQATSMTRLRYAMSFAIREMGKQLRKVIPPTAGRSEKDCRGGMAQVAMGSR